MVKELVRRGGQSLAAVGDPSLILGGAKPKGLESFSNRELGLTPQQLQIVHARRRQEDIGDPGQYKLGAVAYTDPIVVLLKGHHYRTLLEGPDDRPRAVCASANGDVPHDEVAAPKADNCHTCGYGQWRDGSDGKRKPPPCQPGVAFLGILAQEKIPFWFLCRKTAARVAQAFGKEVASRHVQALSDCLIQLKTVVKSSDPNRPGVGVVWYEPVFEIVGATNGVYQELSDFVQEVNYIPLVTGTSVAANAQDPQQPEDKGWEVPF